MPKLPVVLARAAVATSTATASGGAAARLAKPGTITTRVSPIW
jgi:hypothetical protein